MRLDFSDDRVLAIVAHPDDAELLCAGTLSRACSEGAWIGICVLCQGDKGQPAKEPIVNLAEVRKEEMRVAAGRLGAELFLGEVPDGTLRDDPPSREFLIGVLRQCRPTLLLAHAPNDYHTDHRAASQLAESCSWLCTSHGQPVKGVPLERSPSLWWMDTVGMHAFDPSFYVDISGHAEVKEQMLLCHQSQIDRSDDSAFAPLSELVRQQMHARGHQCGVAAAEAFRPHHSFRRSRAW